MSNGCSTCGTNRPITAGGALLADDMGLGKTIQLLTFIAQAIEAQPDRDPFLIVAPVSLLENWKEEINKFFAPGAMRVLTLYGPTLAQKRVPKWALEEELRAGGVTRLLVDGWRADAHIVLTTYETLRDLEFSLAAQRWSAMVCDEAAKDKKSQRAGYQGSKEAERTLQNCLHRHAGGKHADRHLVPVRLCTAGLAGCSEGVWWPLPQTD